MRSTISSNQVELQYATIAQAEAAARIGGGPGGRGDVREQERLPSLTQTESGTRQRVEQAAAASGQGAGRCAREPRRGSRLPARHQLEVLSQAPRSERAADLEGAKATLASAKLKLWLHEGIGAGLFDGVVGERQVQSSVTNGQYRHQPHQRRAAAERPT